MRIQCTVPRPRTVTLGDTAYRFEGDDKGRFVAEVNVKRHAERLLEIDVYRSLDDQESEPEKEPAKEPAKEPEKKTAEVVQIGKKDEPEDADKDEDSQDEDSQDDEGKDESDDVQNDKGQLDRDELAKLYEAKFSKKPHHKLSAARIKQILEEA